MTKGMGIDDFDVLSVTDSGVFSDNDGWSSGRSSPSGLSCKEGGLPGVGGDRERFAILTYDQVKRIDSVLNETIALEGRGHFPAMELKLKDLLTTVKEKLHKEGLKIRDIRLNGGAASYSLMLDQLDYCYQCGCGYHTTEDGGFICSCYMDHNSGHGSGNSVQNSVGSSSKPNSSFSYNDIDLIFGMELSTAKHFDRVKTAVLEAINDLLPAQVNKKRLSPCALKEAYVSKMVKVCEGDRWSLIALGNGQRNGKVRGCSVELKFVDNMRRQYEFSVDSFQIVLDSLMLFYKCSTVPMSNKFYPTVIGESVYGDFNEALFHLHHGLISTRSPEEIRGGGLLKYCNLLVRGYRPADYHSIQPLQRYMCSRFFIDFPEVEQQEIKLRTYLINHMSCVSVRLRYAFLITLHQTVNSSTVCLMGHERRLTLSLIQRLACELFTNDAYGTQSIYSSQGAYHCYTIYPSVSIQTVLPEGVTTSQGTTYYSTAPQQNRLQQQQQKQQNSINNNNTSLTKSNPTLTTNDNTNTLNKNSSSTTTTITKQSNLTTSKSISSTTNSNSNITKSSSTNPTTTAIQNSPAVVVIPSVKSTIVVTPISSTHLDDIEEEESDVSIIETTIKVAEEPIVVTAASS